jgi:transposase InsO family protein
VLRRPIEFTQDACAEYRAVLETQGMRASMSRKGNCWDNAVAERFVATLELELIMKRCGATREDARRAIFRFVEGWYNRERRHSTLDDVSPKQYEEQLRSAA